LKKSKPAKPVDRDELTKDLQQIVKDARSESGQKAKSFNAMTEFEHKLKLEAAFDESLMMKLVPYIVRRDHKIHNHAYQLGKEQK